jgi:hypothetical protein
MKTAADRDDLPIEEPTPDDTGLHDLTELWRDTGGSD